MHHEKRTFSAYVLALMALAFGAIIGLWLPDIDQNLGPLRWLGLVRHRSILTHGFLIPLALYLATVRRFHRPNPSLTWRLFSVGLITALGTHLCFDLFPRAWYGYALIHVPLVGGIGGLFSSIWIFVGAVVSFYLAFRLLANIGELTALLTCLGWSYLWSVYHEPRLVTMPLLALVPALFIAFILPRPAVNNASTMVNWKEFKN